MQRLVCPILLGFFTLSACEIPTGFQNGSGRILDDTLNITIVREETPGFLYPLMQHDIHFVGHLDVSGFIDQYSYKSQDVGFGVILDYSSGYMPDRGAKYGFTIKAGIPTTAFILFIGFPRKAEYQKRFLKRQETWEALP